MTPDQAQEAIVAAAAPAVAHINAFTRETLAIRGGRVGSGMGLLLESLWGFFVNRELRTLGAPLELAWIASHEYNDFACLQKDAAWDPADRTSELFRIESKSTGLNADESKAHFDVLVSELGPHDLLLVLAWIWRPLDGHRFFPEIVDTFLGSARAVAVLRDELHIARGGSFVSRHACPDGCDAGACRHEGEPLNERGVRERRSGPESKRGPNVSYAQNFGGLVRMLKTRGRAATKVFGEARSADPVAHAFISFIHRNFPNEELNRYDVRVWRRLAASHGIDASNLSPREIQRLLAQSHPDYRDQLRNAPPAEE